MRVHALRRCVCAIVRAFVYGCLRVCPCIVCVHVRESCMNCIEQKHTIKNLNVRLSKVENQNFKFNKTLRIARQRGNIPSLKVSAKCISGFSIYKEFYTIVENL